MIRNQSIWIVSLSQWILACLLYSNFIWILKEVSFFRILGLLALDILGSSVLFEFLWYNCYKVSFYCVKQNFQRFVQEFLWKHSHLFLEDDRQLICELDYLFVHSICYFYWYYSQRTLYHWRFFDFQNFLVLNYMSEVQANQE